MTPAEPSALTANAVSAPTMPTRRRPPPTAPTGREGPQPGESDRLYADHVKVQPRGGELAEFVVDERQ